MNEPNYLVKWFAPKIKKKYEDWLVNEIGEKIKLVKEKASNGATPKEIDDAIGEAWKAVAMAKKYFRG